MSKRTKTQARVCRMPFGQHKGRLVSELPDHYLEWLMMQTWVVDPLLGALLAEAAARSVAAAPPAPPPAAPRGPAKVLLFTRHAELDEVSA